jgi:Zn-dependent peptidase ImmA (M78 family)
MDWILEAVNKAIAKYRTRDPYELLDAIGAVVKVSYEYSADGLKGYCTILNRVPYAVINGNLSATDQKIAAGHEAAHLILHTKQIMSSPVKAMRDFNLYDNSGAVEREANFFLADFIVSDEAVLDTLQADDDFFSSARSLYIPAPLFAFKLYSMMRRGHKVHNPIDLDSKFLGH